MKNVPKGSMEIDYNILYNIIYIVNHKHINIYNKYIYIYISQIYIYIYI